MWRLEDCSDIEVLNMANDEFDAWLEEALGIKLPATLKNVNDGESVSKEPGEGETLIEELGLDSKTTAAPDKPQGDNSGRPTYGNMWPDDPKGPGEIWELTVEKGKFRLLRPNGKMVDTVPSGHYNFVVIDGRIYASLNAGHVKLAQGKRVAWAGSMNLSKGVLVRWDNASGHFLPSGNPSAVKNNPPPHPSLTWDKFVWEHKEPLTYEPGPGQATRKKGPQLPVIQDHPTGGAGKSGGDPKTKTPPTTPRTPTDAKPVQAPTDTKAPQAPTGTKPPVESPAKSPSGPVKGDAAGSPPPGPKVPTKAGRSGGTAPAERPGPDAGGGGGSKGSGAAEATATHAANTILNQAKDKLMKIARENAKDKDLQYTLDLIDKALDAKSFFENPGRFTGSTLKNLMIKGVFGTLDPAREAFAKRFPEVATLHTNPAGTGISLESYEKNYNAALAGLHMPDARKALVAAFVLIGVNDKTPAAEIERRMATGRQMLAKMPGVGQYVEKYYEARDAYSYSILSVNNSLQNLMEEWAKVPADAADDLRRRGEALGKASAILDDISKELMSSKALLIPFLGDYVAEAALDFQMLAEGFGGVGAQFFSFAGEVGRRKGEYEQEIKQLEARGNKVQAEAKQAFLP